MGTGIFPEGTGLGVSESRHVRGFPRRNNGGPLLVDTGVKWRKSGVIRLPELDVCGGSCGGFSEATGSLLSLG